MKEDKKKVQKQRADEAQKAGKSWSWWMLTLYVITLVAWVFAAMVATDYLVVIVAKWILPSDVLMRSTTYSVISCIAAVLSLFIIAWLPALIFRKKIKKPTRELMGFKGLPTWTDIGLGVVGYIATIIIAAILTTIFRNFPWFNANEVQDVGYSIYMQGWERGLAFISLVIVAPITEELIFRGWLYGKLRSRIHRVLAILIVSLLFAVIHFQWNVGITVFCLSVVNCIMREVTGTTYAGILTHMLNNGIAFVLLYVLMTAI